jgi:hypothetical protein
MRRASVVLLMLSIGVLFAAGIGSAAAAAPSCTIDGSAGGDVIIGTSGRDVICANGGNDWIDPRGGNDLVIAGPGDDFVRGSAGADVVKGGLGKDYLVGGPGPDHLFGADGADRCLNTRDNIAGNDSASGGSGFDTGTRNPGDTFVGIERTTTVAPYCPPAPPKPF